MRSSLSLWVVAFLITALTAYYQRVTGPSYPLKGTTYFTKTEIRYSLPRSHEDNSPARIEVRTADSTVRGFVQWRRFKTEDPWTEARMKFAQGSLSTEIPQQPPAGKIQYSVVLSRGDEVAILPGDEPAVMRFKGAVPLAVLIPHIIAMFMSMLLAARTGLEFFREKDNLKPLTYWTMGFLLVGGFLLGPLVQHYAFNEWWTGWPFGTDLTDTKTAVALLGWIGVVVAMRKSMNVKTWALVAAVITFVVFLIPHSLLGSELDYKSLDRDNIKVDSVVNHQQH